MTNAQEGSSQEQTAMTPKELHQQNVFSILLQEEHQAMAKILQHRQASAKTFAERIAKLGPKGALQLVFPNEKSTAGKRIARRLQILDSTGVIEINAGSKVEPCLAKVPLKLDLDLDGYKLRDSLLWCLNDPASISPEDFAAITCEDFELPAGLFSPAIVKAINEQLVEYGDYLGMLRMMGGLKEFGGIRGLIRVQSMRQC